MYYPYMYRRHTRYKMSNIYNCIRRTHICQCDVYVIKYMVVFNGAYQMYSFCVIFSQVYKDYSKKFKDNAWLQYKFTNNRFLTVGLSSRLPCFICTSKSLLSATIHSTNLHVTQRKITFRIKKRFHSPVRPNMLPSTIYCDR